MKDAPAQARGIVLILSGFPRRSETFALHEVLALEARGDVAAIFATKRGDGLRPHPGTTRLLQRVQYLPAGDARAQAAPLVQPQFGPPLLHLPELGMVLWSFPNDRKLGGLPTLMDSVYLREHLLPPIIAAHWGHDWQIAALANEVVHYAPEYTCTVRVQLQLIQPQTGKEQQLTLFGKLYEDEQGAETERLMRALWQSKAQRAGDLIIAQPLGYQPEAKVLWQRGLHGTTLQSYELESQALRHQLGQAAETLAALHQSQVKPVRAIHLSDWMARLEKMRHLLPQVWPPCRPMLDDVVERLLAQAACLEKQPVALLHGDLHLQIFFVTEDQVALIDLDNLCLGSPWQDIGSFCAALHTRGLLAGTPASTVEEITYLFRTHYQDHVAWPPTTAAVAWYTAAALINERAARCISRLQAGRLDILDAIVARALQIVMRSEV